MRKKVIQLIVVLLAAVTLHAQHPSKDSIINGIQNVFYDTSLDHNLSKRLDKLLGYENSLKKYFSYTDSTYSSLLRKIGFTYSDMKDFAKSVVYFQRSIDIITVNANNPAVRRKDLVSGYYYLYSDYDSLGNMPEKIKAVDKCIASALELNMLTDLLFLYSLYEKVEYYFDTGDYYLCISTAEMCEKYASEYVKTGNMYVSVVKEISYSALGWHINALLETKNFTEAGKLLANKTNEYKKEGLKDYLAFIYGQQAELYKATGNYKEALSFFNLCYTVYRDNGDDFSCKQVLNNIGVIWFSHFNNSDKALEYYYRALRYNKKKQFSEEVAVSETLNIFGNIANVYTRKNLYDSAFKYFQVAFDQLKPGLNETGILKSSPKEFLEYKKVLNLSTLLIDKGDAFLKRYKSTKDPGDASEALRIYKTADMLLNRVRSNQSDLKSKLLLRSESRRLYEHAADLCFLQKNTGDAFYFFERSRSVLLNDQLNEQHLPETMDILQLKQLNKKIIKLQSEAAATVADSKRMAEIRNELFASTQEKQRLEGLIRVNNPLYYQGLDTNYVTLDNVKGRLLKEHQAFLEIFTGDTAVYILLVTSQNNYFNRVNKREFDSITRSYSLYLADVNLLNKDFAGFRKVSFHLYQLIFQNAVIPAGRIIISTEGRYFPFESLIINNDAKEPAYFLTDHAVSYTYSARYLVNDFSRGYTAVKGNFLGIAPVQYTYAASLSPLTGSDGSLKIIRTYISNTESQLTQNASRNNFLQAFPGYKIIQLYTHASDSSGRNEPVIYFADSALYLSELTLGNIPATRLIVLSACETGNGKLYQGEGVFSFSRGFATLGIPSCIATIWSVDNVATYRLTESFYKYLSKGLPIDVAMQKAKLEFMNSAEGENRLPYFWAAPVLIGKTEPITFERSVSWKSFLLIGFIAMALLALGLYFRKKYSKGKKDDQYDLTR